MFCFSILELSNACIVLSKNMPSDAIAVFRSDLSDVIWIPICYMSKTAACCMTAWLLWCTGRYTENIIIHMTSVWDEINITEIPKWYHIYIYTSVYKSGMLCPLYAHWRIQMANQQQCHIIYIFSIVAYWDIKQHGHRFRCSSCVVHICFRCSICCMDGCERLRYTSFTHLQIQFGWHIVGYAEIIHWCAAR